MGLEINIESNDGQFMAYMAKPQIEHGPVIVCIQEIFGVNTWMRNIADDLAKEGYVALVPDLFWRIQPGVQINGETEEDFAKAFDLYGKFDAEKGLADIQTAITTGRNLSSNSSQKVGTMGFCLGGFLAYMASLSTDADANIGYYGVGIENKLAQKDGIRGALMLHIATADQFVPAEVQSQIHKSLDNHPKVTIFDYNADHAFARKGGESYVKTAADQANMRSLDFLNKHLN